MLQLCNFEHTRVSAIVVSGRFFFLNLISFFFSLALGISPTCCVFHQAQGPATSGLRCPHPPEKLDPDYV